MTYNGNLAGYQLLAGIPPRWVVERPFNWIEKCRSLWNSYDRKLSNSLQFIHIAILTLYQSSAPNSAMTSWLPTSLYRYSNQSFSASALRDMSI